MHPMTCLTMTRPRNIHLINRFNNEKQLFKEAFITCLNMTNISKIIKKQFHFCGKNVGSSVLFFTKNKRTGPNDNAK